MYNELRLQHESGTRVLEFCKANPADTAAFTTAVQALEAVLGAALAADQAFGGGLNTVREATLTRKAEADGIQVMVSAVGRIARAIGRDQPGFAARYRIPRSDRSFRGIHNRARELLTRVRAEQDRFTAFGFTAEMADELAARLDRFEAGMTLGNTGLRTHVAARAEARDLTRRLRRHMEELNAINQVRFHDDPDLLAAWNSARNVESKAPGKPGPEEGRAA